MSLPHDATGNIIRLNPFRAVLPEDGEFCFDTLGIEDTDAVGLCIGIGLTALAPNGGRFDLTVDYAGDGDSVEDNLASARRF